MKYLSLLAVLLAVKIFACGTGRWPVKVGADEGAKFMDTTWIVPVTIQRLITFPAPKKLDETFRMNEAEKTVWEIHAKILKYKVEKDGDLQVVVTDSTGATMNVEFPETKCLDSSVFKDAASSARKRFEQKFHPISTKPRTLGKPVNATIRGVGFFDKIQGKTEVEKNGFELHPVLKICFEGEACE